MRPPLCVQPRDVWWKVLPTWRPGSHRTLGSHDALERCSLRCQAVRAVVCKEYGPPESLVVEEVGDPVPGDGQILVEVKACSVNFPDVLIIQNLYQFKPPLPF